MNLGIFNEFRISSNHVILIQFGIFTESGGPQKGSSGVQLLCHPRIFIFREYFPERSLMKFLIGQEFRVQLNNRKPVLASFVCHHRSDHASSNAVHQLWITSYAHTHQQMKSVRKILNSKYLSCYGREWCLELIIVTFTIPLFITTQYFIRFFMVGI